MKTRLSRDQIIAQLVKRDGLVCQYPGDHHELNLADTGKAEVTIDHWFAQAWAREQGWSDDKIWDLSNLKLMCKKHNAAKGDRIPRPDGTLPPKPVSRFRYRRQKRAERPEICVTCTAGRDLGPDEVCASCGSGPMPERWPRWAKVKPNECEHDGVFWCWMCACGIIEKRGATETILFGGEGGDE